MSESKKKQVNPVPVRLTEEQREALRAIAKDFGASETQLIRWAVEGLLAKVDKEKEIRLPFKFE